MWERIDTRYVHKAGNEIRVRANVSLMRDAKGAPAYIVAALADLTASKQAEDELQRHLHFTRAMLDAIPIGGALRPQAVSRDLGARWGLG